MFYGYGRMSATEGYTGTKRRYSWISAALIALLMTACLLTGGAAAEGWEDISSADVLTFSVNGDIRRVGDFLYRILEDGTAEIVEYVSNKRIEDIPSVIAGYPVSAIGDYAFANEGNLRISTDEYWDYLREYIRTIHIPEGIVRIGDYAFLDCFNLTQVTFPDSLRSIGKGAFSECKLLMNITLPDHLQDLGDYAFWHCYSLVRMNIPATLASIGANPFADCWNLARIQVAAGHPTLRYEDGMLYDADKMKLICLTKEGRSDPVTIPAGMRIIGDSAMSVCPAHEIMIPDSVTEIGDFAFADCIILRELVIPANVQTVGNNPFKGCTALHTVAFSNEQGRYTVRDGMVTDEEEGRLIAWLKRTKSDSAAIYWAESVKDRPVTEKTIGGQQMRLMEYICIPSQKQQDEEDIVQQIAVPEGIRTIGAYAFYGARIREIILPESVIEIREGAFAANENLEKCLLPAGIRTIPDSAFEECISLKEMIIPEGVTAIGARAFADTDLTEMILPSTVETMGRYAFSECRNMEQITLDNALTTIPRGAFSRCTSIREIYLPNTVTEICAEAFSWIDDLEEIHLPSGLDYIADYCFFESAISRINIPAGIEYIGEMAFLADGYHGGCIEAIELPEGLKYIGARAFDGQRSLEEITFPGGLLGTGDSVFANCMCLERIYLSEGITALSDSMFEWCSLKEIRIPETVSRIGADVFSGTYLETLAIPSGHLQIDGNPFTNCQSLQSITVGENHPNLIIEDDMLIDVETQTVIAGLKPETTISVTVPDGIRAIGTGAFSGYYALQEIRLPESMTRIGAYAFAGCHKLETIRLPEALEEIGADAFSYSGLKEIRMPDSLRVIGAEAFYETDITEIVIPEKTEKIGKGAFDIDELQRIVFPESEVRLEGNIFATGYSYGYNVSIEIPENHPSLELVGGNLYDKTDNRLLVRMTDELIRDGTVEIAENAINYDEYHVLPGSIRKIPLYQVNLNWGNDYSTYVVPGSDAEAFLEAGMNYAFLFP